MNGTLQAASSIVVVIPPCTTAMSAHARWRYRRSTYDHYSTPSTARRATGTRSAMRRNRLAPTPEPPTAKS